MILWLALPALADDAGLDPMPAGSVRFVVWDAWGLDSAEILRRWQQDLDRHQRDVARAERRGEPIPPPPNPLPDGYDYDGFSIPGTVVEVVGPGSGSCVTDAQGICVVTGLPPGTYTATASHPGCDSLTVSVTTAPNVDTTATVPLSCEPTCTLEVSRPRSPGRAEPRPPRQPDR